MQSSSVLIGCASGFSGDRLDAALPVVSSLIERQLPAYLIFETLAERTLALAQLEKQTNVERGYEPALRDLLTPVLQQCLEHRIPIIGNFGAANPKGAAAEIAKLAKELGIRQPVIYIVEGDDAFESSWSDAIETCLTRENLELYQNHTLVSANVYLGAKGITEALKNGADIVVCGRVSDPSLTVGPLMAFFNKSWDDWDFLGKATMAGHLLECGAQVTGGYFADPGKKDVSNLANVGFPIAEVNNLGEIIISKAEPTGGLVNRQTVIEQLLYEVHDPARYLTPDVTADITQAQVEELGKSQILVKGITGHKPPETLKGLIYYEGDWLAEAEISYSGPNALARAQLAGEVVQQRMKGQEVRIDLIGVGSIFKPDNYQAPQATPSALSSDVRVRFAINSTQKQIADHLVREVGALYTCGPAAGGGVRSAIRRRLFPIVFYIAQELVTARATRFEEQT